MSSPDDDQRIPIETSSCNLQFFSELITTQLRDFHMVSPQVVFFTYLPHHAKLQVYVFSYSNTTNKLRPRKMMFHIAKKKTSALINHCLSSLCE